MLSHHDRPFRGVVQITAAAEFIFAAERMIARDVRPETLPEHERACVEYYLELLSKKFSASESRANISRILQNAMAIESEAERTVFK